MHHRRHFIKTALGGTAGLIALPNLFTGSLFAATSANKRVQVAQIGCGRMGLEDMGNVLDVPMARVVAVCDLDSKRAAEAKRRIEEFYKKKGETSVEVKVYSDYRELLADPSIDAVVVNSVHGGQSVIRFKSFDQGRSKWQADTVDAIWLDEEPPYDVYEEAITRTNTTNGPIYITFTPLKGMSEVVRRFPPASTGWMGG